MELLGDFSFFGCVAVAAIPAIILGIKEKSIKYYTFCVTVFFVWMAMGATPKALIYMVTFAMIEYGLVRSYLILREKYGRKGNIYGIFVALSIAPLVINKISGFTDLHLFGFLGVSYMTFKTTQMIIEIYDGIIKEAPFFEYINFLFFFPTLTSGPIDRSRRFHNDFTQVMKKDEYLDLLGAGLFKICLGLVYRVVIAAAFYQGVTWSGIQTPLLFTVIYMYAYGFYLFFDFAGYSLMAVGISYIFGIKTPDNFNKPFVSKDIKEFWDRWHISLSYWFRDFIFSRLMMRAIRGKWFKDKVAAACMGFMVNMTVMGIWHGVSWQFILYGIYHGILLSLTEIYQKKSPFYKKHKNDKWYQRVSWFVTFNLVMFGFLIFSGRFTMLIGL
ncbi:MAG: D-alanyl-lipoteichoic acid biosynthesis protein DltB [Anaerovoracaceae bacterium]